MLGFFVTSAPLLAAAAPAAAAAGREEDEEAVAAAVEEGAGGAGGVVELLVVAFATGNTITPPVGFFGWLSMLLLLVEAVVALGILILSTVGPSWSIATASPPEVASGAPGLDRSAISWECGLAGGAGDVCIGEP